MSESLRIILKDEQGPEKSSGPASSTSLFKSSDINRVVAEQQKAARAAQKFAEKLRSTFGKELDKLKKEFRTTETLTVPNAPVRVPTAKPGQHGEYGIEGVREEYKIKEKEKQEQASIKEKRSRRSPEEAAKREEERAAARKERALKKEADTIRKKWLAEDKNQKKANRDAIKLLDSLEKKRQKLQDSADKKAKKDENDKQKYLDQLDAAKKRRGKARRRREKRQSKPIHPKLVSTKERLDQIARKARTAQRRKKAALKKRNIRRLHRVRAPIRAYATSAVASPITKYTGSAAAGTLAGGLSRQLAAMLPTKTLVTLGVAGAAAGAGIALAAKALNTIREAAERLANDRWVIAFSGQLQFARAQATYNQISGGRRAARIAGNELANYVQAKSQRNAETKVLTSALIEPLLPLLTGFEKTLATLAGAINKLVESVSPETREQIYSGLWGAMARSVPGWGTLVSCAEIIVDAIEWFRGKEQDKELKGNEAVLAFLNPKNWGVEVPEDERMRFIPPPPPPNFPVGG